MIGGAAEVDTAEILFDSAANESEVIVADQALRDATPAELDVACSDKGGYIGHP